MTTPLLDTEDMITYLVGDVSSVVRDLVRERIYSWKRDGKIRNHGGTKRGHALWNPREVLDVAALYAPPSQCVA